MWKNTVDPDRPQMTILRMRIAGWVPKATNTHSQYVILIAFHRSVVGTRLSVTLNLHCLSYYQYKLHDHTFPPKVYHLQGCT